MKRVCFWYLKNIHIINFRSGKDNSVWEIREKWHKRPKFYWHFGFCCHSAQQTGNSQQLLRLIHLPSHRVTFISFHFFQLFFLLNSSPKLSMTLNLLKKILNPPLKCVTFFIFRMKKCCIQSSPSVEEWTTQLWTQGCVWRWTTRTETSTRWGSVSGT